MNLSFVVAAAGVATLMGLRVWALRASPSSAAERPKDGRNRVEEDKLVFRRRLWVYYGFFAIFVIAWLGHAVVLKHRAAELERELNNTAHP